MIQTKGPILFLGIGGSGMSSLAHMTLDLGVQTYGYDKNKSETTEALEYRGAIIFHTLESFSDYPIELAVYSSAFQDKGFLLDRIRSAGIPLLHRSSYMHQLVEAKTSISVAGSHGKTSTTTMLSQILEEKNFDPTIMIGGESGLLGKKGGKIGRGLVSVYESDESDGTFLNHKAHIRILTNIDNDHLDYYKTLDALQSSFVKYLNVEEEGHSVICGEDIGIQEILKGLPASSNFHPNFELWISIDSRNRDSYDWILPLQNVLKKKLHLVEYKILEDTFLVEVSETSTYAIDIPFPGWHYRSNAILAILAAKILGVSEIDAAKILSRYVGVKRRQEVLGERRGVQVIDDYGHHPTEIEMVIRSLSQSVRDNGNLVVLFQPHRYTRTQLLLRELANSLANAKFVFLLPIYSAGEEPIPNVTTESFLDFLSSESTRILSGRIVEDIPILTKFLKPNDTLLCLGAGNVRDWGLAFLNL